MNQFLRFYKTIYLLIMLSLNSYGFAQNCFTDELSLSQTYLTLIKKSLIVYEKFKNKPMKLKAEKNYSYSNTFKILSNDKELIQIIESYDSKLQCLYNINEFIKKLESKKKINNQTDVVATLLNFEYSYYNLLCNDQTEFYSLSIINKPLTILKENCSKQIPQFEYRHQLSAAKKDLLIENIYNNMHTPKIRLKQIMDKYNQLKNKENIKILKLSGKDLDIVTIVEAVKDL